MYRRYVAQRGVNRADQPNTANAALSSRPSTCNPAQHTATIEIFKRAITERVNYQKQPHSMPEQDCSQSFAHVWQECDCCRPYAPHSHVRAGPSHPRLGQACTPWCTGSDAGAACARACISWLRCYRYVQAIAVKTSSESGAAGAPSNKQENFSWKFHDILHNSGQDTVYETLCSEVVPSAVAGTNSTIMAYGQARQYSSLPLLYWQCKHCCSSNALSYWACCADGRWKNLHDDRRHAQLQISRHRTPRHRSGVCGNRGTP